MSELPAERSPLAAEPPAERSAELPTTELPDYAVISPVKDEARDFERTAQALLAQTHRPRRWVVVDDGSTDRTFEIASRYAAAHDWITVMRARASGRRERGAPIVRAFNQGLASLQSRPDFVVKLDGDLFLPAHYFAWVAATFAVEPRAGVVGGVVFVNQDGEWVYDRVSRRTVHGAIKAYRYDCLEEIGGLHESMGWDGIDEYGARARGWGVHVLSELSVLHYKTRGSAQPWLRARWEEGRGVHYMGYRVGAVARRVGYRMLVEHPPLLGGLVLGLGFCWYSLSGAPQAEPRARAQLRAEQRGILLRRDPGRGQRPALADGGPAYWLTGAEPTLPSSLPTSPNSSPTSPNQPPGRTRCQAAQASSSSANGTPSTR
jgi:biofilm PGA synthesis N-glycosyltransferase PgaC